MRRFLLLALLLAGCQSGREIDLYPTPGLPAGETSNYYYTALAHYRAHETKESALFARYAVDKWTAEKAPSAQIRLARELLARSLAEQGDRKGALEQYRLLLADHPKVVSYQKAVQEYTSSQP